MLFRSRPSGTVPGVESDELDWDVAPWTQHLRREEQDLIDRIIQGLEGGRYFILLGPKVCTFSTLHYPSTTWANPYLLLSGHREDNHGA